MPRAPIPGNTPEDPDEELIDEALDESFPASDPAAPAVGHGQPRDRETSRAPSKRIIE